MDSFSNMRCVVDKLCCVIQHRLQFLPGIQRVVLNFLNCFELELDNGNGVVIRLLVYIHQQKKTEKKEDYSEN